MCICGKNAKISLRDSKIKTSWGISQHCKNVTDRVPLTLTEKRNMENVTCFFLYDYENVETKRICSIPA